MSSTEDPVAAAPLLDALVVLPPSPTHPDPAARNEYWYQRAEAVMKQATEIGARYALGWALRDAYYEGVSQGIQRLHDTLAEQRAAEVSRG